jgi:hypothetical protein
VRDGEENITEVVELLRGYKDIDGVIHRRVELRPSLIDDEIKRDAELAAMAFSGNPQLAAESESELTSTMLLIRQVTVQFGTMRKPPIEVYRSLSPMDFKMILAAKQRVDLKLNAMYLPKENEEGNDDDGSDDKPPGDGPSTN